MKKIEFVDGGVCAPKGFRANGVHCGIRKNREKKDLALIVSETRAAAAGVYTRNLVKGAPILVTKEHLKDGYAQAVIVNSGNANTCNANGVEIAEGMCALVERETGIKAEDVIVASTGVIGQTLSLAPIEGGIKPLAAGLGNHSSAAAEAIMTTDTVKKECAVSFLLGGKPCTVGAICKGVGMINPNMATLLLFVTTDVAISPELLQKAISHDVSDSLNMLSVDGDTSTNDTFCAMANGLAGNPPITTPGADYKAFTTALAVVTQTLCRKLARDGEGATKLIECEVSGAKSKKIARTAAKSVIGSNLVKAAMFGADANWGRILCALGYAGVAIDIKKIDVSFEAGGEKFAVCSGGAGVEFSEESAKRALSSDEIRILVNLNDGRFGATAWGCDLTYDYVKINGDYRT